jgi:hypothetical protein
MITLPSGKQLPDNYTDQDIFTTLGAYSQEFGTPTAADWDYLIVAFDQARYLSLNPARKALFDNYTNLNNPALDGYDPAAAQAELDEAVKSDQPYVDEEIDLQMGSNGPANKAPGTIMAQRRFAYMYTSGPAYSPTPVPPVLPPSGPIPYTLVPPPPYVAPTA